MKPSRRFPFLLLILAGHALAAEPAPASVKHPARWRDLFRTSAFSIVSENDKYFAGTDRHYTNGLKLSFLGETRVDESPALLQKIVEFVPTLNNETARRQTYKVGVSLGHNTYTPGDTDTTAPIPDDRPYAGWLYGALTFQAQSDDARLLRVVELSLGIVGPSALGRQVQNNFHHLINVARANGWTNQLHDEPGLILSWERRYRVGRIALPIPGFESDFIARGGVSLGNIRTNVAAGFAVRVGWRLPPDFGADLIRPAGGGLVSAHRFSAYFFGSGETRAVARDIFLDGNTWRDSLSVAKRPVVADLNLGLVLRMPLTGARLKGLQLTYTQNYRTKEFYGQLQRDVFGSVGITFLF
ncbi:MAG TPA: lipid A deacylase LpxR family protein [Lacunisphaera sp.]|nr:lipid A deacylase LpxR family protein [Lacunisphaera sp.]